MHLGCSSRRRPKLDRGYERPFDHHRSAGNDAIDAARALLIFGFGFNDRHLQTHLEPRLRDGTPALIAARTLTANARKVLDNAPQALALFRSPGIPETDKSTTVLWRGDEVRCDGVDIWDLKELTQEVLA